jgi:hypothetical protein
MKAKRISALILAMLLLAAFLTACGGGGLDGTYTTRETLLTNSVTFNKDKVTITVLELNISGTYKISGSNFIVTTNTLGVESEQTMSFERKGKSLFIEGVEYIKDN